MNPNATAPPFVDTLVSELLTSLTEDADKEIRLDAEFVGEDLTSVASQLRAHSLGLTGDGAPDLELGSANTIIADETSSSARRLASEEPSVSAHHRFVSARETEPMTAAATRPDHQTHRGDDRPTPRQIGRYAVLRRLGAGGMGEVYAAYDESLHRKIAIKVLRVKKPAKRERARQRLIREAQAMARVVDPNVATVFEVGDYGDQLYVSMEYIDGANLREWLDASPRSPGEIVKVFAQAGRGLAAVHRAGLVHRDFKPGNVMVDADGRARVLDFGLVGVDDPLLGEARGGASSDAGRPDLIKERLTRAGAIMGTPAYMAPEQFAGAELRGSADQFSFCVALYEALFRVLPFHGENYHEFANNVLRGRVRPPPLGHKVPRHVLRVITRGLRPEPADRFPSMETLLTALEPDRSRARARWGLGLAVSSVAASGGVYAMAYAPADAPCSGVADASSRVWNEDRRVELRGALETATGSVLADELAPRVLRGFDEYAEAWVDARAESCLAHDRGERSDARYDRQSSCFERRLAALDGAASILAEADRDVALRAVTIVERLSAIETCMSNELVDSLYVPPSDPAAAARLEELRGELTRAETHEAAGVTARAVELASSVVNGARELNYRPLEAQALLVQGRAQLELGVETSSETTTLLMGAGAAAIAAELPDIAAEAITRALYTQTMASRSSEALQWVPMTESLIERSTERARLRGLLLNNLGAIEKMRGHDELARQRFARSLELRERLYGPEHSEVALTRLNLGLASDDPDDRQRAFETALASFERLLGPSHPDTLDKRIGLSLHVATPSEAIATLQPACETFDRVYPEDAHQRWACRVFLGHHLAEAGDLARAGEVYREASELLSPDDVDDEVTRLRVQNAAALARLHTGEPAACVELLRSALPSELEDTAPPWSQRVFADARVILGRCLLAQDQPDEAAEVMQPALPKLREASERLPVVEAGQKLASARWELAQALTRGEAPTPESIARARELADAAAAWYEARGAEYQWRLDPIRQWEQALEAEPAE